MSHRDFVALVAQMRLAQKAYFATRSPAGLEHSKRLEREVDRALIASLGRQLELFDACDEVAARAQSPTPGART